MSKGKHKQNPSRHKGKHDSIKLRWKVCNRNKQTKWKASGWVDGARKPVWAHKANSY